MARAHRRAGHDVVFATERGATPAADPRLLTGVIFGQLGAADEPKRVLRGDDAAPSRSARRSRGTRSAPTSSTRSSSPAVTRRGCASTSAAPALQRRVGEFWALDRPVGAICHGVLVLARTVDPGDRPQRARRPHAPRACRSTWSAARTSRPRGSSAATTARTPPTWRTRSGPRSTIPRRSSGAGPRTLSRRGTETDDRGTFVVEDGRYVSARWPGDAYAFARALLARRIERDERREHARVRQPAPPFRRATVVAVTAVTPRLTRVTLRGEELVGFPMPEPAGSVRLLLPGARRAS